MTAKAMALATKGSITQKKQINTFHQTRKSTDLLL